jgi:hypothetical protein
MAGKKISPKDFMICFSEARKQGLKGDQLLDAVMACVRRRASEEGESGEKS